MFKALNGKGVSTALATTAIILVLVMSLTWMAYTVVLNARQQAQAAERAESIALKAKELIRVYVWLDPAQQTNGQYLNLTRISFVGSWSGETTINGLLVVYRDGSSRMLGLNIRLGAGEEKTYLPSELGIAGLSIFYAAFLGLAVVTMVILGGPKLFMPLEAAYVLATAATVYRASREDADNIVPYYRRAVKKVLPPILVLMVVSALVEAYEIV